MLWNKLFFYFTMIPFFGTNSLKSLLGLENILNNEFSVFLGLENILNNEFYVSLKQNNKPLDIQFDRWPLEQWSTVCLCNCVFHLDKRFESCIIVLNSVINGIIRPLDYDFLPGSRICTLKSSDRPSGLTPNQKLP